MSIYSEWKPRKVLEEIYEECRRKRTLPSIRPILAEKLNARGTGKSDDLRKFTHNINGQKWVGFIYNKRNSLMGSTFGFYKNKFTIVRGYPKIKYIEDSRILNKEVVAEYKVDGCYDEETEVLSENGWKKFNNLQIGERLYTRNAEEKIELQACEKIISMNYDGILHHYQMRNLDSVVTPDHWNFVSLVHKPKHSKSWFEVPQRIQSKNMKNKRCIFYSDGTWEGKEEQVFRIGSMCLPMNLWLKFLGYWLTDGTKNCHKTSKEGYQVVIVQRKESWKQMFEVTKQLFPEATYYFNQSNRSHIISICNKNLWNYLNQFGMKHQRFIPKEIKFLQKSQLTILFDALLLGDGSKREKYIRFWTCSERMRDDFQELCLKVGFSASYSGRKKDSNINGRPIIAKRITYCLNVRLKHLRPLWIPQLNGKYKSRNFQEIEYHGNIYCAIVPNHVLYVRRNGKPIWSGNTNLGIWAFQDGSLMGKTRLVERWDKEGWHGRNWRDIFERTKLLSKVMSLCKEDYQVFGELYGKENEGEFIKYTVPIAFTVLDIMDRRNFGFLDRDAKIKLCNRFELPLVEENWRGILTEKEAERLEFQAKELLKEDGYEGFVAKSYILEDKDVYFCKLKCQEVRERCWGMSSGFTIPSPIIMKAVQKATENLTNFTSKDEFEQFVREELLEEASEELINKSKAKIQRIVERKMANQVNDEEVIKFLDEMTSIPASITGISIDISDERNKRHIMKTLADKFIGLKPATLYQIYERYKKTKSKEKALSNIAL
jgi:hypothetical protein